MAAHIKVAMTKARTTKNTIRYEAIDPTAPVGLIYVQKAAFAGQPPERVVVNVEIPK